MQRALRVTGRSTTRRAQNAGDCVAEVAARLGRDKQNCKQRYGLLGKKAQAAGSKSVSVSNVPVDLHSIWTLEDLLSYVQLQVAQARGPAFSSPLPTSPSPPQPAATTAAQPHYSVEDDAIILRMYLQGASAKGISTAIDRSTISVHRRWTEKRDEWIAAGNSFATRESEMLIAADGAYRPSHRRKSSQASRRRTAIASRCFVDSSSTSRRPFRRSARRVYECGKRSDKRADTDWPACLTYAYAGTRNGRKRPGWLRRNVLFERGLSDRLGPSQQHYPSQQLYRFCSSFSSRSVASAAVERAVER